MCLLGLTKIKIATIPKFKMEEPPRMEIKYLETTADIACPGFDYKCSKGIVMTSRWLSRRVLLLTSL